jgi:hypothetical protein
LIIVVVFVGGKPGFRRRINVEYPVEHSTKRNVTVITQTGEPGARGSRDRAAAGGARRHVE